MQVIKSISPLVFSFGLILGGVPTLTMAAGDEATEAVQSLAEEHNNEQANDQRKVVCRKEARVGTRIKKEVCRSVSTLQWEERYAKEAMAQRRSSVLNKGP